MTTTQHEFRIININGFLRVQNARTGLVLPAAYLMTDRARAEAWIARNGRLVA